jgi:predicted transposase/invertase (TIGR01784 family)
LNAAIAIDRDDSVGVTRILIETMSKQLGNIHDSFFKQALSDPGLAGTFLREHLPPAVADLLGPEVPEAVAGSFVDEDLRQHHSDVLFRMHLRSGSDAFAYVLMEQKSSPDPGARLQLLRYVVRLLTDWYGQNKQRLPLPPVVPLLVHQGPEGWELSCEFTDLFGAVPESLRPYLPSFRHALVDLGPMEDHTLSAEVRLRAFLKALKYSRRSDLPARIGIVLAEAETIEENDLFVILTYFNNGPVPLDINLLRETVRQIVPDREERIMGWFSQPYYEKGLAEGEVKGEVKGEARGEAKILARLLEKRFGVVPSLLRERIFSANVGQIEAWVERAFDAPDLQSIFDTH